jgi:hypothetical protein
VKVIDVPSTIEPLLGEAKVGAEGREGVSSPDEQASPDTKNIYKQNTMIILEFFIFYLPLIGDTSNRMLRNK